jgi:hypothetical protein
VNRIPLADFASFAHAANRTTVVRRPLAARAPAVLGAPPRVARHPHVRTVAPLARDGGTIVVLDVSASVSTDTYQQIGATLSELAHTGGRLGLVVFSDQAYLALPQGTPAAALLPLVRLFTPSQPKQPGFAPTLPANPWTSTFSGGTRISAGLALAHQIAVGAGTGSPAHVVLISDLSDDPNDLQRLASVLLAYRRDRVPMRIVGLDPEPSDLALYTSALPPSRVATVRPSRDTSSRATTPFPWLLAALGLVALVALGTHEAWSPRPMWRETV